MPTSTATANGVSASAIGVEPAGVREVDDAEAVEELGERVAAERDEAPEHERVHRGRRTAAR